jgi:hypothetical protein
MAFSLMMMVLTNTSCERRAGFLLVVVDGFLVSFNTLLLAVFDESFLARMLSFSGVTSCDCLSFAVA